MLRSIRQVINFGLVGLVLNSGVVQSDVLELKNGKVLNGSYQGGTVGTLRFQVNEKLEVVAVKDILALTFTGGDSASASGSKSVAPASTTATTTNTGSKKIPAGTKLMVKIAEEIGTHNTKKGQIFTATLESKLMSGSVEVAPAGAKVYGIVLTSEKSGIGARKSVLELTLNKISIKGKTHEIKTSTLRGEGASGGLGRKIIKGAAIGALADGSSGADTGARVGAGVGLLSGGKHAGIKAGTIVEFSLKVALSL
jgi:hypothetical protein